MNEIVPTKTELVDSLVSELNRLHLRAYQLDETIKKQFSEKLQVCRQISELIESARSGLHMHLYQMSRLVTGPQ
jgi:hypothetical protein